jgi:hypothetical protein
LRACRPSTIIEYGDKTRTNKEKRKVKQQKKGGKTKLKKKEEEEEEKGGNVSETGSVREIKRETQRQKREERREKKERESSAYLAHPGLVHDRHAFLRRSLALGRVGHRARHDVRHVGAPPRHNDTAQVVYHGTQRA